VIRTIAKWAGVALGVLVLAFIAQRIIDPPSADDSRTFSEFLDQVDAGEVESVTFVPSREELEVEPGPGAESDDEYEVGYPVADSGALIEDLRADGVPLDVETNPGTAANLVVYLIPFALYIAFWVWLAGRLRGLSDRLDALAER